MSWVSFDSNDYQAASEKMSTCRKISHKLNIVFVASGQFNEFTGGIDRVCCQLIRAFLAKGIGVSVVYLFPSTGHPMSNVNWYQLPDADAPDSSENVEFLSHVLQKEKADILWNHSWLEAQMRLCAGVRRFSSIKLAYTFHSDFLSPVKELRDQMAYFLNLMQGGGIRGFIKSCFPYVRCIIKYPLAQYVRKKNINKRMQYLVNNYDLLTFLANATREEFCRAYSGSTMTCAVPNFIDNDFSEGIKKEKMILFVGRLVWQKRLDRVLRLWKRLMDDFSDWTLEIVGDGPERNLYENMASRLGLKRVTFSGSKSALPCFKRASIACITSSHEGFSLVALEAMRFACVPIAYDSISALHDVIAHGIEGFLVPAFSERKYEKILRTIMKDDSARLRISEAAVKKAEAYTSVASVNKYILAFQKILGIVDQC